MSISNASRAPNFDDEEPVARFIRNADLAGSDVSAFRAVRIKAGIFNDATNRQLNAER